MRIITTEEIEKKVYEAACKMCFHIDNNMETELRKAFEKSSSLSKSVLEDIMNNIDIARNNHIPVCQDTGIVTIFLEMGQNVHIEGNLNDSLNNAIKNAYKDMYLRKSVVLSPLERKNTNTNTPILIHTKLVLGDQLKISILPKGAGSENMGALKMLSPSSGIDGIKKFVIETIKNAGGKGCPPYFVGVGIGGTMDYCALLSKEALLRDINDVNPNNLESNLENELLNEINKLNIGPMGLKGNCTAIACKINTAPCHIASLPVSVSLMCHAYRHEEIIL